MICHGPMVAEERGEGGRIVTVFVCKTCLAVRSGPKMEIYRHKEVANKLRKMGSEHKKSPWQGA